MRPVKSLVLYAGSRAVLTLAALVLVGPMASAQPVTQNLTIGFSNLNQGSLQSVPLSAGLTAGIALMLAVAALVMLRRRAGRGGRLFGWALALVAGTTLVGVTGQRPISEAQAIVAPITLINLSVSPAILNVGPFSAGDPLLTVEVTNTTGQSIRITSITLDPGPYSVTTPTTCAVGGILAASAQCTITLEIAS